MNNLFFKYPSLHFFRWPHFLAFFFLLATLFLAFFYPWFTPYTYEQQEISLILQKPSWYIQAPGAENAPALPWSWMGRDTLGRDLFARLMFGARVSLAVALITAFSTFFIGALYGSIAGWWGGWPDRVMMRLVDILYTLPHLLLMMLITTFWGRDFSGIFLALSLVGWLNMARLVRSLVIQAKKFLYVEAAHALGLSPRRILWRHIFPNILGPILVTLTYQIPNNILAESFLSFIGLGLEPPMSSWGTLAHEGWHALETHPHLIFFPALTIFFVILSFNVLGDALRDYLDPQRLQKQALPPSSV